MMNKKYIQHSDYIEALKTISESEQDKVSHIRLLDEAFYGFGPCPSDDWFDMVLSWVAFEDHCITESQEIRTRYESEQYKLQTLKECKSKKPLGSYDLDPDDIDFDDIDSPNFFDIEFPNPHI
tara:strand:+ start:534 stop:902 length:369 start_codon:yes stop_codon:yes gene_type:complete